MRCEDGAEKRRNSLLEAQCGVLGSRLLSMVAYGAELRGRLEETVGELAASWQAQGPFCCASLTYRALHQMHMSNAWECMYDARCRLIPASAMR